MYKKPHKRTRDKGTTRGEIIKLLSEPRTIPDIKWRFGTWRLAKDCSIETAMKNMLADGLIEVIQEPRHCYQAAQYRLTRTCVVCGHDGAEHALYLDAACTKLDCYMCSVCRDVQNMELS